MNRFLITGLVASLVASTASADTLREALNATYRSNPTLMAQREGPAHVAELAGELEQAAREEPDMHELVSLTTELLHLCESRQTTCLKELQTAAHSASAVSPKP